MRVVSFVRTGIVAVAAAALSAVAPAPGFAAALPMTLSATSGPSGGGNPIAATITSAGSVLPFPAGTLPVVQFQYIGASATPCATSAEEVAAIDGTATTLTDGVLTVDPATVRRITTTKLAFTVPSAPYPATDGNGGPSSVNADGLALLSGQISSRWNVCVYDTDSTTSSTLIGTAAYTIAIRPTISAILPASSPPGGGQTVTVNGSGFGAGTTATIDGAAVTDIRLAANGNSFSASTAAHAPGTGLTMIIKTAGGTVSSNDPDNNTATADTPLPFSYDNSVTVSPNTAPAGSVTSIDISGTGFQNLVFDSTGTADPTDAIAHVFLVKDAYDPDTNRGAQECTQVLVVNDTELVCQLDLSGDRLDPATSAPDSGVPVAVGTYTITVVADGSVGASDADPTIVTSGSTFTVGRY